MDWLAAGATVATLALAAAAFWQIRMTAKEGIQRQRREVADRIYAPTAKTFWSWTYRGFLEPKFEVPMWSTLKVDEAPTSYMVPPSLVALFELLESAGESVNATRGPAMRRFAADLEKLAEPLKSQSNRKGAASTQIQCFLYLSEMPKSGLGPVDLLACWLNDLTLDEWVQHVAKPAGPTTWEYQVLAGGFLIGSHEDAHKFATDALARFDATKEAAAFKQAARDATSAASDLQAAIDGEQKRLA